MSTTPPPEDPFPAFGSNGENPDPFATDDSEPLDQGRPNVASNPGRALLVLGVIGAILAFLLYSIFSGGDEEKEKKPRAATIVPATTAPPPLPPVLQEPTAPPPAFIPPTIPAPAKIDMLEPKDDGAEKARLLARMRSNMMLANGGGSLGNLLGNDKTEELASDNPNDVFAKNVYRANTKAPRVLATRIGNLNNTIAQGRIIQATLESVINTELPGQIRAIVSRDTYGEAGRVPLIPKGSRLIGTYSSSLAGGQTRAYVVWTRIIRPDGVDIMVNSPLTDRIGQAGIGGQVDTKFQQIFSRALMSSVVAIAIAIGSEEISPGDSSTTNSAFGGTTQSGEGATGATANALNRLGSTTDSFLQRYLNLSPSILVDQGTPVNVFVSRDLVFPGGYGAAQVIP